MICTLFELQTPLLSIEVNSILFVSEFKYLGRVINSCMSDDDDINRKVRNMFTRTNVLIRKFGNCSVPVKLTLFSLIVLSLLSVPSCFRNTSVEGCYVFEL